MGAAEGTKMDDDFVEMERVWKLNFLMWSFVKMMTSVINLMFRKQISLTSW